MFIHSLNVLEFRVNGGFGIGLAVNGQSVGFAGAGTGIGANRLQFKVRLELIEGLILGIAPSVLRIAGVMTDPRCCANPVVLDAERKVRVLVGRFRGSSFLFPWHDDLLKVGLPGQFGSENSLIIDAKDLANEIRCS